MALAVNSDSFEKEVVQAELPVVVDFWGPQCAPCLALMPQVEQLAQTYAGRVKITKIDASRNRRLCLNLRVMGLPTFLFYKNGENVARLSGQDLKIADIEQEIQKLV